MSDTAVFYDDDNNVVADLDHVAALESVSPARKAAERAKACFVIALCSVLPPVAKGEAVIIDLLPKILPASSVIWLDPY